MLLLIYCTDRTSHCLCGFCVGLCLVSFLYVHSIFDLFHLEEEQRELVTMLLLSFGSLVTHHCKISCLWVI